MAAFNNRLNSGGRFRQSISRPTIPMLPKPEASQARIESVKLAPAISDTYRDKTCIENVEYVASFNWKDTHNPTILVPGKPPRWQPPSTQQSLAEDAGSYHRDPNSARFPSFPSEPAIRAIFETVPNFDMSDIDVFGCGNTVGSLLSFARQEERTFRFGVDYIGSTLFLVRKTDKPGELIDNVYGYGHSFPEAYTRWDKDTRGSVSHQRIIKYDFAGLRCMIRSESDGYLPDLVDEVANSSGELDDQQENVTDTDQLLTLALGLQAPSAAKELTLYHAGKPIPQQALFDLKTRTVRKPDVSVDSFLHRLWVNQTPNMVLAFHDRGTFSPRNIHIIKVKSKMAQWEKDNKSVLSKLGGLLHKLIGVAKCSERHYFEVRRIGSGPLEIWSEVPQWSALPNDLRIMVGRNGIQHDASEKVKKTRDTVGSDENQDEDEELDYLKF